MTAQNHQPLQQLPQRQQRDEERLRDPFVRAAEERVEDVAAIQLADRQQVQRGGEHADPGRARHRVQVDIGGGHAGEDRRCCSSHCSAGMPNWMVP